MVRGLAKPSFNPPPWVFAPVWVVLYALIALAGWRSFERDTAGWPMRLWWAQLGLNFLWPPVFFAAHRIALALVVILLLLAAILAFSALSWRRDRVSAWLFVPYAAWVAFASVLEWRHPCSKLTGELDAQPHCHRQRQDAARLSL
jgi:tryptophan-rich sensory protein